ncbi:MAG: hypothetical protein PWP31_449 [Clostridia bacterium]|nr:hypothetical protein [Clostridia bacterium]
MDKNNLVDLLSQLIGSNQQENLKFNELAGLLGLVDLLGILNLLNGNSISIPQNTSSLQQALNSVLSQGQQSEGSGNLKSLGDIAGFVSKNPALLTSLMNLFMNANKESKGRNEKNAKATNETPSSQNNRGNRFRSG